MVGNITLLMIFAFFDQWPLTLWINCSYYLSLVLCYRRLALSTGDGNFRPPTISIKLLQVITSAVLTAVPNLVQIRPWWLLGKWVKYNKIIYLFIYTFFMNSPTSQTRRRIFTLDGSNDADSRKGVPFGGFVDTVPNFGGEIPRNPHFWGVNGRFQAKQAKY